MERETGIKFLVSTETILTTSRESLGGECVPSPCGRWLVEEEDSWVVVAIQKVKVFDVDDPFCESAEVDGVTGKDAVVLTAQQKTTDPNHH